MSPRPRVIVDAWSRGLLDPATGTIVGRAQPFGRERIEEALPLRDGPRQVYPAVAIVDCWGCALSDPATGTVVGVSGMVVHRFLEARFSSDTRAL